MNNNEQNTVKESKVRKLLQKALDDELAAKRWSRGLLLALSGSGLAFADQLADIIEAPGIIKAVKVAAVVAGFLAGAITAGEKNQ